MRRITAFLVFFVSLSVVYVSVAYYLLTPRASQPFMAVGVYSESGSLSSYTGGFGLPVSVNQTMRWTLRVDNEMGAVQLVRLLYRIGNSTTGTPTNDSPSPDDIPVVNTAEAFVAKGESRTFAFTWVILRKTQSVGSVSLNMTVNGAVVSPPIATVSGNNFRFLFELWAFDLRTNSFQYVLWNQVWFDAV